MFKTIKKKIGQQVLLLAFAALACAGAGFSQASLVQPSGTPFTLKKLVNDQLVTDELIEPSAVVPIGTGKYLIVANDKDDDNGNSLTIVETKTGKIVKLLENIQGNKKNPKWEAMAKDSDNFYYAIGSHSVDVGDNAAKLAVRSRIFRFKLKNENALDPMKFSIDTGTVTEFDIKQSLTKLGIYDANRNENDADPDKKKAKIEGLAVKTLNGVKQLVIGLRQPFDMAGRIQIYTAELPKESYTKSPLPLLLSLLFQFNAGKPKNSPEPFRLSSIEYVSELQGFLLLTSTEDAGNRFYGNAMWFVSDGDIWKSKTDKLNLDPVTTGDAGVFEPMMKAEGITMLPATQNVKIRLVIVYDNDSQTKRADGLPHPSTMQCVELSDNYKKMKGIPC